MPNHNIQPVTIEAPLLHSDNGEECLVVQDARTYRAKMEERRQLGMVIAINHGIADMRAGRVYPAEEVFSELKAKYGLSD